MADSICHACRRIDFGKVLESPATYEGVVELDADVNRLAETSGTNCPLCRLLASTLLSCENLWSDPEEADRRAKMPYRLSALSFLRHCPWTSRHNEGAKDCHILLAPRGLSHDDISNLTHWVPDGGEEYVACLPKRREAGLFVPELISDTFDHNKAKSWLRKCRMAHSTACNGYVEAIPGLKAIDCETLRIVEIQKGDLWVALSYVWGHDQPEVSPDEAQAGTIPGVLSRTIHQAIEVTKGLGYKYLWVDRYCINQQDEREKHGLIAKMDMIYHGADLTIVAAAGHNEHFGLPGIGTTPRKKQKVVELDYCTILSTGPDPILETKRSRWWTRGWTLQEAFFSRRRLIFTEHQSYFECDEANCMEALGGLEFLNGKSQFFPARVGRPSLITWLLSSVHGFKPLDRSIEYAMSMRMDQFSSIVKYYTERYLTFDTDSLNAFAGISRYLRDSDPPLAHILGIPFMPSMMPSHGFDWTEKGLFYFLCWFHHAKTTPRRRQNFPSWTWAGWAGRVGWMADNELLLWDDCCKQKMRYIQFEVDGHLIPQEAYLDVFDPARCYPTNSDVILRFQARVVPPSMFSWNTYVDTRNNSDFPDYIANEENDEPDEGLGIGTNDYTEEGNSDTQSQEPSQVQPPDPNDWGTWTVGMLKLWDQSLPPDCGPEAFMENLQNGCWDCLLLGDYGRYAGFWGRRFLLVVEWLDDGLACRVGCVVVNKDPYVDRESEFFDESELSWKSVRVI